MHASHSARTAGFVLCGGASTRMGRDKALLVWNGSTLVEHAARAVEQAAGTVTLIGSPARYGHFGWPTIADDEPGHGPLGGLVTALRHTTADWNLVTACDMPGLDVALLEPLVAAAHHLPPGVTALVPVSGAHVEALCAVYHRDARTPLEAALAAGRRKMADAVAELAFEPYRGAPPSLFRNLNTPSDWRAL